MGSSERKTERRKAAEALRKMQAAEARRRKTLLWVSIGAAVVLIGGLLGWGIWNNSQDEDYAVTTPTAQTTDTYGIAIGDGPVEVDLFIDFMCPVCNEFESTYSSQIQSWLDDGSITVNYHPIAILNRLSQNTEYSTRAAAASVCAADVGEDEFLSYMLALYENQPEENSTGLTDAELISIGTDEVGLDADWRSCVEAETYRGWVDEGTDWATGDGGVSGTPTAKVDGTVVEDNGTFADDVQAAIDAS